MKKTLRTYQEGATLVVVMIMMLLISLIATLAFRKSASDLKIATSAQVGKLLFQNTDMSLAKIEEESRSGHIEQPDNVVGYLRLFPDDEITFCMRPRTTKLLDTSRMTHKIQGQPAGSGYKNGLNSGYCEPSNQNDYVTARRASMNQVTVKRLSVASQRSEAFGNDYENSEIEARKIDGRDIGDKSEFYEVTTISVLPVYSNADIGADGDVTTTSVSGCLKQGSETSQVDACLQKINVPYNSQVQSYQYSAAGFKNID